MRGPKGLIGDHRGTLYVIEAVISGIMIVSTLACIGIIPDASGVDRCDDLKLMSADLLQVLEGSGGSLMHSGLAQALSSQTAWEGHSHAIECSLRSFMPAGYRVYLRTPYGDAGDCLTDCVPMSVRPFLAYRQETGDIIECSLIVWRP
jgi:hypothetical protein